MSQYRPTQEEIDKLMHVYNEYYDPDKNEWSGDQCELCIVLDPAEESDDLDDYDFFCEQCIITKLKLDNFCNNSDTYSATLKAIEVVVQQALEKEVFEEENE